MVGQQVSRGSVGTPFRGFDPAFFLELEPWQRLERMLTSNGGCYGLVGARGAGKSWCMLKAIGEANERGGLGLWFPAPSEYKAEDFLSSLSDELASGIEQSLRNRRPRFWALVTLVRRFAIGVVAGVFGLSAVALLLTKSFPAVLPNQVVLIATLAGSAYIGVILAAFLFLSGTSSDRSPTQGC